MYVYVVFCVGRKEAGTSSAAAGLLFPLHFRPVGPIIFKQKGKVQGGLLHLSLHFPLLLLLPTKHGEHLKLLPIIVVLLPPNTETRGTATVEAVFKALFEVWCWGGKIRSFQASTE